MNRREVLVATAAIVGTGCLGDGGSENGSTAEPTDGAATTTGSTETNATDTVETTTATETATPAGSAKTTTGSEATETTTVARTETPAGTTTDGPTANETTTNGSAADRSFTVRETGGEPGNEASVTVESGGSRIVVTGTITGENGCQTATLNSVRTDAGEVRIVVATERAADAGTMCTQALVGISYRATVTTESQPASVTVIHRGAGGEETVTTAEPGG
ncbi:hypothetical protein [Halococcus saccharolyticus]|uniref:Lipoprotein n=1 Tax=Halococcus saccharolyticus DSM 5350 TaxID=1227455 RepID=M0MIB2_9EURY|nr:hypothetical protein [Halococcus saccharolyticus]EMA44180.1 hypothetical protein C449_11658 [Halococcus saccharolyticus DSM 5350]